jgi:hypothetical protein
MIELDTSMSAKQGREPTGTVGGATVLATKLANVN